MSAEIAIEYDNVSYAYPGAATSALEGVSLRVGAGERLGVLGPNGGGKTTLLRLATGELRPATGRVRIYGAAPKTALAKGWIGCVQQRCEAHRSFPINVRQAIEMGASRRLRALRRSGADIGRCVERSAELVGVRRLLEEPVGRLSGGQWQRVRIARALASEPRILTLDEPTVGVDMAGQRQFASLLTLLHRELKLTILLISHDLRVVAAGADRVACLARTVHFHDAPQGLTPQTLAEVFEHDVSSVFGELHIEAHRAAECQGDHTPRQPETPGDDGGGEAPS